MGNEIADLNAKQALKKPISINHKLNLTEINSQISVYFVEQWQQRWKVSNNFLQFFKPKVTTHYEMDHLNRRSETSIRRLRLGVTGLNCDLVRIGAHPTGHCEYCLELETVTLFNGMPKICDRESNVIDRNF